VNRHITNRLSAYLDGALGVHDLEHVRAHLEICPNCLQEYQELQVMRGMLRRLPEPAVPEGFAERIHWRLQREAARRVRPHLLDIFSFPPFRLAPFQLVLACATLLMRRVLPLGWMLRGGVHETPLDTDAYLRDYLVLSADRPLTDEVATSLETSNVLTPEPQTR